MLRRKAHREHPDSTQFPFYGLNLRFIDASIVHGERASCPILYRSTCSLTVAFRYLGVTGTSFSVPSEKRNHLRAEENVRVTSSLRNTQEPRICGVPGEARNSLAHIKYS